MKMKYHMLWLPLASLFLISLIKGQEEITYESIPVYNTITEKEAIPPREEKESIPPPEKEAEPQKDDTERILKILEAKYGNNHADALESNGKFKFNSERLLNLMKDHDEKKEDKDSYISKRGSATWPKTYGVNLDLMAASHPNGSLREGFPTDTHTCHTVTSISSWYKSSANMYLAIDGKHYKKMTEAYGIPIIGSSDVRDASLKRACYVIKTLLACRYDIRLALFKLYIRVALIGDNEKQTTLPEYRNHPNPDDLNRRVRGLGPTRHVPLVSAGDDNQRCKKGDRYFDQDILVHEFAHGIEQMAALHVIPGFQKKLYDTYLKSVKTNNKWGTSYASTNSHELFGVAVQFYFNAFRGTSYQKYGVVDRNSMRAYDPDLTSLLDEVFPCAKDNQNELLHRCLWHKCTVANFKLKYDASVKARSMCPKVGENENKLTLEECANFACYARGNAFNWKGSLCEAVLCPEPVATNLNFSQSNGAFNIYYGIDLPVMDLSKELSQVQASKCTNGPHGTSLCKVGSKVFTDATSKSRCKTRGFCWGNGRCFFPKQACPDKSLDCPAWAKKGECSRNPNFMYYKCAMSCDICNRLGSLPSQGTLMSGCGDFNEHCEYWAKDGNCESNPTYMLNTCKLSCAPKCTVKDPLV